MQQGVEHKLSYSTGLSGDIPKRSAEDELLTKRLRTYATIGYSLILEGSVAVYSALRNYSVHAPRFFNQIGPGFISYAQFSSYSNVQLQDGIIFGVGMGLAATGLVLMGDVAIDNIEYTVLRRIRRDVGNAFRKLFIGVGSFLVGAYTASGADTKRDYDYSAAQSAAPPAWATTPQNVFNGSLDWAYQLGAVTGIGLLAIGAGVIVSYLAYDTYKRRKLLREKERVLLERLADMPQSRQYNNL